LAYEIIHLGTGAGAKRIAGGIGTGVKTCEAVKDSPSPTFPLSRASLPGHPASSSHWNQAIYG